jgi:hypothetical protein
VLFSEESIRITPKSAAIDEAGVMEVDDDVRQSEIGDKTVELLSNVIRYLVQVKID